MTSVLVVEDEDDIRLLARVVLEQAGFDVYDVASGDDVLGALASDGGAASARVVLLDLRMAGVDGFEVLERLGQAGYLPGLVVVVVSAHADPDVVDRAKALGAWGYLRKPFRPDELVDIARAAAGQPT